MDFQIGNFDPDYYKALNQLAVAAFSDFKDIYKDWPGFSQKINNMASLAEQSEIIVATKDRKLLGAVAYIAPGRPKNEMFSADWAILRMLVVDPDERGRGIGKALTLECLHRAVRDKASHIGLHTSPIMTIALPMYFQSGFVKQKDVPHIHGVPYAVYVKSIENG